MLFDNSYYVYFPSRNSKLLYNHESFLSVNVIKFDFNNKNFFLIRNKYNFLKMEFGFFNSAKEERINNKFLKTLIERSVDFLLIKKMDRLIFGSKKIDKIFFDKRKTLTAFLESNNINIKRFYFKIFISKIKKLFYKLTSFELEGLNYFTKKNLLNFCFNQNLKPTIFLKDFFDFSFSLIFQKFYFNYIVFNYSKFFFFNIINYFFKKNQLFFKKIIVNYINTKLIEKRYILLQFFNKNNVALQNKLNNLNHLILYDFYNISNIFDLKKNLKNYNFLIYFKKEQINFYFEKKINNFSTKIGFYDNLNFFFSINRFQKISIFLNFQFFYSNKIFLNVFNYKRLDLKKNIILNKYIFDCKGFQIKNLNKNMFVILKKNKKFINFVYFFESKDIRFCYDFINVFDNIYKFDIFYICDFIFDIKVQLINSFLVEKNFFLFNFLKKNKNLMLENLDIEKMNPKTYYKKFFLKKKCNELFSTVSKLIKIHQNNLKNISFQNFRFFFDIFFLIKFKIKILLKKKNLFFNKIELKNFISKFFKNFINFTFFNTRISLKEYNYLLKNILIFLFKNKGVKNYFFFNKLDFYNKNLITKSNYYNLKTYNLFIKNFSNNNNFLLKLLNSWNSKIFLNQYFNKRLNVKNFHFNFIINLNYNFLLVSKYSKILNKLTKTLNFEKFNFNYLKQKFKVLKIFYKKNFLQKSIFQNNTILFFLKKNYIISNLKYKLLNIFNIFYFTNLNTKIQYYFFKTNIVMLKYLNNILNHCKFQNNFLKNEDNYFKNFSLFFDNLSLNFENIFKINKLNFQNFEFLLSFSIFNNQNINPNLFNTNKSLFKRNKIHYKFLKKIINVYLNFIFIKKNSFLTNFNFIYFNKYNSFTKINKIFNLMFLKSNIYFKKYLLISQNVENSFLKFLYLKIFFYKNFLFFYTKIIFNFFKFLQNKLLNNNLFNFNNVDLKIYSFFFLTKKNQKKKNLLWLKIDVTKRNVFVNLFVNKKKPSVFVFTAGQTLFEGRLKKTKEAGMIMGRKLWKRIVFLSKKNFIYNTFFLKNPFKIFNFFKINNYQIFFNKVINFQHPLKNSLINYQNILIKKLEKKKKIYNIFNKQKIIFFDKDTDVKYLLNKYNKQVFIYKKLKINNNNLFYNKYNKIKLYLSFYNKVKIFYLQNFNFIIKKKYNFIFQFFNFNLLLNKLIKYKKIKENIVIRIWLIKKIFYKKKLFIRFEKFYKKKKFIKHKILINKKKILIKDQKFTKKYVRKFQKFRRIELYIKKLYYFIKNNNKYYTFLNNKIKYNKITFFKKFNIFFKIKENDQKINRNFNFIKKIRLFFFIKLKLKKIILINFYLINNFFFNIKKKKSIILLKRKFNKYYKRFKKLRVIILFNFKKYKILNFNFLKLIFLKIKSLNIKKNINFLRNKNHYIVFRLQPFLNFKQKMFKYLHLSRIFLLNFNFCYFLKFKIYYKYNILLKKKNFIKKFKDFIFKVKFYNYFLNNYKVLKKNIYDKQFPYYRNRIKNFSNILKIVLIKLNYLFYNELIPKFLKKKDNVSMKIISIKLPLLNYSFSVIQQLNSIYKDFINKIRKINESFSLVNKYKEKKIKYRKYKIILKSFFSHFGPIYRLISKYLRSNFLYEFFVHKKRPVFKEMNRKLLKFVNLFYFLKRLFKSIKDKILDFVNYTNLHSYFKFSKKFYRNKIKLLKKKKKLKNYKKSKVILLNNKKIFFKKFCTFFYWKNLKIKIYKKILKYSLFFLSKLFFINQIIQLNKNFLSRFISKKKFIKKIKFIKKKNLKSQYNKFKNLNYFKSKNLFLKKNGSIYKNKKILKTIGKKKLINFFYNYKNFICLFKTFDIKFLNKFHFLINLNKFYFLFGKIKKVKKKYLFTSFYNHNTFKDHVVIFLKKVFKKLIFNKNYLLKKKFTIFIILNKKAFKAVKLLNCKFFHFLNKFFKHKIFRLRFLNNNILNNFFFFDNNYLFENFYFKFNLNKNKYFYLINNNRKISLIFRGINNFILKKKFKYNKYKILINSKNLINYKKYFFINFLYFLKLTLKKNFLIKKKQISINLKNKIVFLNYNFLNQKKNLCFKFKCKLFFKYNLIFYIFKFYKQFVTNYFKNNLIKKMKFSKNLINLSILDKKNYQKVFLTRLNKNKFKNLKKVHLFLLINSIKNKFKDLSIFLLKNYKNNNLILNEIIQKNKYIKNKKLITNYKIKSKKFSLNFLTSLFFFNKIKNIIYNSIYLLTNRFNYYNLISLKVLTKNIFKRWRKYYSNFDNKYFVPKKGFLIILTRKKNRIVRGIYKGFIQQARGRKLFKRLKPRFVKFKKFIFTRSRKVKGRRK